VVLIFGMAALALALAMGGALDIAHLSRLHSVLQSGADAAALSAARFAGTDATQRKSQADGSYVANVAEIANPTLGTLTSVGTTWTYTARHPTETTFLKMIGITTVTLEATATATASSDTLDVALVLDNSGSMANNNRMVELKKAVKLFLGSFPSGSDVQVALVPFDSQVKVEAAALSNSTSNAPANPFVAATDCHTLVDSIDGTACTTAQTAKPTINCNTFATSAPYYAVSQNRCNSSYNSGGFKAGTTASYTDCVSWDLLHILCLNSANLKYTTTDTGSAVVLTRQEWGCTQYVLLLCSASGWTNTVTLETRPYTPDPARTPQTTKTSTDETANANLLLQPTDVWSGCLIDRTQPYDVQNDAPIAGLPTTLYPKANCTVGTLQAIKGLTPLLTSLATAVDALQPSGATNITIGVQWGMEALTASAPLIGTSSSSKKNMIVMTDGMNTQDRWWGDGTANSPNRDKIDARTRLACDNAKKAGITVYTINLVQGDPTLLTYCASDQTKYFAVTDAAQLSNAFLEIANMIKRIRLTK
jgi:Mg-chelatase subunit ChlD